MPRRYGTYKNYDEAALVEAIACGGRTQRRLARELGFSEGYIAMIAKGRRRPELLPKIRAARERLEVEARRTGQALAEAALARLARLIAADSKASPAVQRRAAADIIRIVMADLGEPPGKQQRQRRGGTGGKAGRQRLQSRPRSPR